MKLTISSALDDALVAFIEKLNKKAVKFGFDPILCQKEETIVTDDLVSFTYNIEGRLPVISGWNFIAKIEHDPSIGNIVSCAVGNVLPVEFRNAKPICEHCGTKRARSSTFILQNVATGEHKQIGRTCIKDFTGWDDVAKIAWLFDVESNITNYINSCEEDNAGMSVAYFSLVNVIARTLAANSLFGFVSKTKANEMGILSTADDVSRSFAKLVEVSTDIRNILELSMSKKEEAEKIVEWIKSWKESEINSGFKHNLFMFAKAGICRIKDFGTVCFAPTMFEQNNASKNQVTSAVSNEHIGEIGEKIKVNVKIARVFNVATQYGATTIYTMSDATGNCLTWFSSKDVGFDVGAMVECSGTVKDHSIYNEKNQTVLTRCKFVELADSLN